MISFPVFLTIYAGFAHAFELDHLLAVSNIVTQRQRTILSMKDGLYWGLGHASTIMLVGVLMIIFKEAIPPNYFHLFELAVGLMLIGLALFRIAKYLRKQEKPMHAHIHVKQSGDQLEMVHYDRGRKGHALAYSVGLVHGLAGSGALILVVMSQMKGPVDGLTYLLIFGIGCLGGMLLAAALFSIPFSRKMIIGNGLQTILIFFSCLLCIFYGGKIVYENFLLFR